jgi:carboxynorspermidine decarboxylase
MTNAPSDILPLTPCDTPAFIYDELALTSRSEALKAMCRELSITLLFPIKCFNCYGALGTIAQQVQGFSVSSLFEARLAQEILEARQQIHLTSPGLRDDEIDILVKACDRVSFNSLSQWKRFRQIARGGGIDCGLRINPQLSFVADPRYDPCRQNSRLGVALDQLRQINQSERCALDGIEGIHFHTNCDSTDWSPLLSTVRHLDAEIPWLLQQCRWINLGGGYLIQDCTNLSMLRQAVALLHDKYRLEVIIEPGSTVVRDACVLVAHVVDLISTGAREIAVLNTTVNHLPEVFEYQFSPDVLDDTDEGPNKYLLTGATCLAGDVFGEYAFDAPLRVGSRVTFTGVGAYSVVKSHLFNGINLPAVYALTASGDLRLQKQYGYGDFRSRCGADADHETVRNVVDFASTTESKRSAGADSH